MSDRSVRVQLMHHNFLRNKKLKPMKAFRLRMKDSSTFGDLVSTAIARYAKDDPENGGKASIDAVLDEANCAVELDETLDLVGAGEILKLVLAKSTGSGPAHASLSSSSDDSSSDSESPKKAPQPQPARRPAVKQFKPRMKIPSEVQRVVSQRQTSSQKSTPSSKPTGKVDATPAGSLRKKNPVPSSQPSVQAKKASTVPTKPTTPGKPDPYDIPSGSDDERKDALDLPRASQQTSKSSGKRALSHTVNAHVNIVDLSSSRDQDEEPRKPPYTITHSKGSVPIYLRGERPETAMSSSTSITPTPTPPSSGPSSTTSPKRRGSLLHSPSTTARLLLARSKREKEERERAEKVEAEKQAALERSKKEAKARKKANMPQAAIAHIKGITKAKFVRKEPARPVPASFFEEAEHSDEDLGDIITGSQYSIEPPKDETQKLSQQPSSSQEAPGRHWKPASKAEAMNPFRRINTLSPAPKPQPDSQRHKTFGAGYSQRVRDAFSDSEEVEPQRVDNPVPISDKEHNSTMHDAPKPRDTSSPTSTGTDNTSTLITKQLTQDAPPSNQEQGILMSSSPSRGRGVSEYYSPSRPTSPPLGSEKQHSIASSSEPSSGIPAHLPPRRTCTALERPQLDDEESNANRYEPPSAAAMYIKSGIAERRFTRPKKEPVVHAEPKSKPQLDIIATPKRAQSSKYCDADLDVTPNFELALSQVETPSTKARSTQRSPAATLGAQSKKSEKSVRFDEPSKVVVKIPMMSAETQAMYARVPTIEAVETDLPLKSFREINRGGEDADPTSQDSEEMALDHVLKVSPEWLSKPTEIAPDSSAELPSPTLHPARHLATDMPPKTPSKTASTSVALKRKRNSGSGTDEVDSAYSPPVSEGQSDGSHSGGGLRRESRQTPKNDTPRKVPALETSLARQDVTVAQPQKDLKAKTNSNKPSVVSRTPVPAPTIASLLEKIKETPKTATPKSAPPKTATLNPIREPPKLQGHTPIPPPVIPVFSTEHRAASHADQGVSPPDEQEEQERKQRKREKRKRKKERKKAKIGQELVAEDKQVSGTTGAEPPHKKQKKAHQESSNGNDKTATSASKAQKKEDAKLIPTSEPPAIDDKKARKKLKNRERELRKQQRVTAAQETPVTQTLAAAPRSKMNKKERKKSKRRVRRRTEAMPSGYGRSPSLPPMLPKVMQADVGNDVIQETSSPRQAVSSSQEAEYGPSQASSPSLPPAVVQKQAQTHAEREISKPRKKQTGKECHSGGGVGRKHNVKEAAGKENRQKSRNSKSWKRAKHGKKGTAKTQDADKPMSPPITSRPSSRGSSS